MRALRWVFLVGPCRLYLYGEASGGSPSAPSQARHAGPSEELSWRVRGRDRLVPASLAGFFALMAVFLFGGSLLTSFEERPYAGQKVVVTAELLRYDDGNGKRHPT